MTISTLTIKNSYSGDGSTSAFTYTFKITDQDDIQVIIRSSTGTETVKTITTHYTVAGVGSAGGGTITFTAGNIPASSETVILRRDTPQTQGLDLIENDPLPANSLEDALDKITSISQELQEEVDRSLKLSRTNTMTSTEFTVGASDRANKILAFDSAGEISVTQELGTYKGTDATTTTTAYVKRDIVKSTTVAQLNNVYICIQDSPTGTLLTNTSYWSLLIDAVSAATSATAAAASASAAASSASAAATSESNAGTSESNAATSESNASTSATNAANSATSASNSATTATSQASAASSSASAAASSESNAATSESNAATSETNASNSATAAASSASTATTQATNASSSASSASTSASNAASSASTATTQATNASNSATAAAASAAAAAASADNFDDTYLGAKASDPSTDNDGDPLNAGDLYFNTTSSVLKYYDGSSWQSITPGITTETDPFAPAFAIALG
jgi:hypothetical protein